MYLIKDEGNLVRYIDEEENREAVIKKENFLGMFETGNPPAMEPEDYRDAVLNPVEGSTRLYDIIKKKHAKNACILISDATRGVPTETAAAFLVEELNACGIKDENILFIVALGVHRDATEEEMKTFLGKLYGRFRIVNHNPYDPEKLVYLGKTTRKTPVSVNKTVYESDLVLTIGKVELHDMAGFSGGRKSILPGVSSEETIVINHRPDMMVDPGTYAGNLHGNPLSEDMLEAALMCGVDYSVNIVMNQEYKIAGIFSGDLTLSHEAAANFVLGFCKVELPEKPDIYLVCPGKPLSIDMYQGMKALIAIHKLAESGTTIILYGSFDEGINSVDFLEPFKKYPDLKDLKKFIWENYRIQMDHIVPTREVLEKGAKIMVVSGNVSEEDLNSMHMEKKATIQEALDAAITESAAAVPKVAVCPQSYRCMWSIKE